MSEQEVKTEVFDIEKEAKKAEELLRQVNELDARLKEYGAFLETWRITRSVVRSLLLRLQIPAVDQEAEDFIRRIPPYGEFKAEDFLRWLEIRHPDVESEIFAQILKNLKIAFKEQKGKVLVFSGEYLDTKEAFLPMRLIEKVSDLDKLIDVIMRKKKPSQAQAGIMAEVLYSFWGQDTKTVVNKWLVADDGVVCWIKVTANGKLYVKFRFPSVANLIRNTIEKEDPKAWKYSVATSL
jgi:hypothetical protein